jgi:hypothetical protein
MEAYCLEEQDQILVNGEVYRVIGIEPTDEGYSFQLVSEEGSIHTLAIADTIKVPVVIDNMAEV